MKINKLIALINSGEIKQESEVVETIWRGDMHPQRITWGWLFNFFDSGDIKIGYQNTFEFPADNPADIDISSDIPETWVMTINQEVTDENGETLKIYEIGEILEEKTDFCVFNLDVIRV